MHRAQIPLGLIATAGRSGTYLQAPALDGTLLPRRNSGTSLGDRHVDHGQPLKRRWLLGSFMCMPAASSRPATHWSSVPHSCWNSSGRGHAGTGWHHATRPDRYARTCPCAQSVLHRASWAIKCPHYSLLASWRETRNTGILEAQTDNSRQNPCREKLD